MPPSSGTLTRKQQWLRMGRRRALRSSTRVASQKEAVDGERASQRAAGESLRSKSGTRWDSICRDCLEPPGDTPLPSTEPLQASTHPNRGSGTSRAIGSVDGKNPREGVQCASTASSLANTTTSAGEVLGYTRKVRFDRCVRVLLVPSRRDLDAATVHGVWWAPADLKGFRCAAFKFSEKHGNLSCLSKEELEEAGPPPGMPPLPLQVLDDADVAGGGGGTVSPADSRGQRRRREERRHLGTLGRRFTTASDGTGCDHGAGFGNIKATPGRRRGHGVRDGVAKDMVGRARKARWRRACAGSDSRTAGIPIISL